MSNTLNTTMNSEHTHPFLSDPVRLLIVKKCREKAVIKCYVYLRIKAHLIN
jgi:hypothetical protein